jgi:hypothetical protein
MQIDKWKNERIKILDSIKKASILIPKPSSGLIITNTKSDPPPPSKKNAVIGCLAKPCTDEKLSSCQFAGRKMK